MKAQYARQRERRRRNRNLLLEILFDKSNLHHIKRHLLPYSLCCTALLVIIVLQICSSASSQQSSSHQHQHQHHHHHQNHHHLQRSKLNALSSSLSKQNQQQQPTTGDDGRLLVCPLGWQQHSSQCYKFFHQRHSWSRARQICERHGAQLALIHDYQQNNFTTQLASSSLNPTNQQQQQSSLSSSNKPNSILARDSAGDNKSNQQQQQHQNNPQALYTSDERSYWIGFRAIDRLETNTLESAANTFVSKYIGFWDFDEPRVSQGECVRATVRHESLSLNHNSHLTSSYKLIQPTGKLR